MLLQQYNMSVRNPQIGTQHKGWELIQVTSIRPAPWKHHVLAPGDHSGSVGRVGLSSSSSGHWSWGRSPLDVECDVHRWYVTLTMASCQHTGPRTCNIQHAVLYSAVSWQICSFRHQLDFSGKHSSNAAISRRLFSHISTTVSWQVFVYVVEWTVASWREQQCNVQVAMEWGV